MSEASRPQDAPPGGRPEIPEREPAGHGGEDGTSIADRVGRNPGNLGDDVPEAGDVTHPTPDPDGPQL